MHIFCSKCFVVTRKRIDACNEFSWPFVWVLCLLRQDMQFQDEKLGSGGMQHSSFQWYCSFCYHLKFLSILFSKALLYNITKVCIQFQNFFQKVFFFFKFYFSYPLYTINVFKIKNFQLSRTTKLLPIHSIFSIQYTFIRISSYLIFIHRNCAALYSLTSPCDKVFM